MPRILISGFGAQDHTGGGVRRITPNVFICASNTLARLRARA